MELKREALDPAPATANARLNRTFMELKLR